MSEATEGEAKEGEPQVVIREFFDAQSRDKIIPIIKHLDTAEKVLLAVENMDEAKLDLDRLDLLVK